MESGIQYVRIAVMEVEDFHKLLTHYELLEYDDLYDKCGEIVWSTAQSVVNDNFTEVLISMKDYQNFMEYNDKIAEHK